jgi:hypothetical protein
MKLTVTQSKFVELFSQSGRGKHFSYEGLRMLFDHIEECDPDFELDIVGLDCDYTEADWHTVVEDYRIDMGDLDIVEDEGECIAIVREWLQKNTCIVGEPFEGVFLYASSF